MPSFDGETLIITLDSAVTLVNGKVELYSDWKEYAKTGTNSRFSQAFDTTGGDPTTATGIVAPYFFLRNDLGWRIKPPEEDIDIVINGNLYPRDAALPMFTPTTGAFTVLVTIERDASSVVERVGNSGVEKGVALPQWHFSMFDASNPQTPIAGRTVSGFIAKDAETSFTALSNSVIEMASGSYQISGGLTAAETNADVITLLFTASGAESRVMHIVTVPAT